MAVISTGDELIPVNESPRAHQLRRSNIYSLNAALSGLGIEPLMLHLADDPDIIRQKMQYLLGERDVIVISGGVSKGKYDHIPQILEELQVETIFHRVKQRPGKPFLFGMNKRNKALVFAFPGNPVSTFFNYHLYFIPWFNSIYKIDSDQAQVKLATDIEVKGDLLQLIGVRLNRKNNEWQAEIPKGQHSGNLIGLSGIDGFIKLDPKNAPFKKNDRVTFTKIYPW